MAGVNDLNRLKNTTCYLCGPMDRVDDGGVGWREDITPILKEMGIGVLNPCNKPTSFAVEDGRFREGIDQLKKMEMFSSVADAMKEVAAIDLRMIDIAHFVIMYIDMDVHMCGSYHEAFVAIQQKKPLLVMCKQGSPSLPNWLFGVMPHQHMFSYWTCLTNYLEDVHTGKDNEDYNRWRFFDFEKIYTKEK